MKIKNILMQLGGLLRINKFLVENDEIQTYKFVFMDIEKNISLIIYC